jgi:GNAT superfamily N-acetyltransferase
MRTAVTTYHLEMTDLAALRPARTTGIDLEIKQARVPCPELNRFFYTAVGGDWFWIDRLSWNYERWQAYLGRPELETWIGYHAGTPAGYFELEAQLGSNVEIVYFGILPQFVGKGLGGAMLTAAVQRAWQMGPTRVWVHTCTLDHPSALGNYLARGFRIFKQELADEDLPEQSPGPWPGAGKLTGSK